MLIQKIFHVRCPLLQAKSQLSRIHGLCASMNGVHRAMITADGVGEFDCTLPSGLNATCVLVELPSDDGNQVLFESSGGNVDIAGMIEFVPIKDSLTEVQITLEYGFKSVFHRAFDRIAHSFDRFLEKQIRSIQQRLHASSPQEFAFGLCVHAPIAP